MSFFGDRLFIQPEPRSFSSDLALKEQAILLYELKVFHDLDHINQLKTDQEIFQFLIDYLSQNWEFIKGTCLSYTAIPEEKSTLIFCEIAERVAAFHNQDHKKKPLTSLEVLMPGLQSEAVHDDYPTFSPVPLVTWHEREERLYQRLKKEVPLIAPTFDEKEQKIRGQIEDLSMRIKKDDRKKQRQRLQTLEKKHPQLIKKIAQMNARNQLLSLTAKKAQVEQMQQQIRTHQMGVIGDYGVPKYSLKELLNTHIVSTSCESIIPVSVHLNGDGELRPYGGVADEKEKARLIMHSAETLAVYNAQENFTAVVHENSNLLSRLKTFCAQLRLYDAHEGVGKQESAGSGAYPAIIAFYEYYHALQAEEREKVPSSLQKELEKLYQLATDPTKNFDATANMETCIGLRREALEREITGNEAVLRDISFQGEAKIALFNKAKAELALAVEQLEHKLKSNTYQGSDHLPLSKKIIEVLEIPLKFHRLNQALTFMEIEVEEINALSTHPDVTDSLIAALSSLEDLVIFLHTLPTPKMKAFLEIVGGEILKRHCPNFATVTALLISFEGEKLNILLKNLFKSHSLKEIMMASVNDPVIFSKVLALLPLEKRINVLADTISPEEQELLRITTENHNSYKFLLESIPVEDRLQSIFSNSYLLNMVRQKPPLFRVTLESLSSEQQTELKQNFNVDSIVFQAASPFPQECKALLELLTPEERQKIITRKVASSTILFFTSSSLLVSYILEQMSPSERYLFLEEKNAYGETVLYRAIHKPELFLHILSLYPPETRLARLTEYYMADENLLSEHFSDSPLYEEIVKLLPASDIVLALQNRNKADQTIFQTRKNKPEQYQKLLELLPQDVSPITLLKILPLNEDWIESLREIPKSQRFSMVDHVFSSEGSALNYFLSYPLLFLKIIALLPAEDRLDALMVYNDNGNTIFHQSVGDPELYQKFLGYIPQDTLAEVKLEMLPVNDAWIDLCSLVEEKKRVKIIASLWLSENKTALEQGLRNPEIFKKLWLLIPETERLLACTQPNRSLKSLLELSLDTPELFAYLLKHLPESAQIQALRTRVATNQTILEKSLDNPDRVLAIVKSLSVNIFAQLLERTESVVQFLSSIEKFPEVLKELSQEQREVLKQLTQVNPQIVSNHSFFQPAVDKAESPIQSANQARKDLS